MAGYLVLARKYRSATFAEVVGQEPIARTLESAIRSGRVAHAYLFNGTRGVGKTTMARILAKALNCLAVDAPTTEPCNECDACRAIARGDDVDVIEIDGASNRGIEEIRELRANAIYRPARSRYKIYYIDEVHQITRDAFNALLKTLEEPPGHVKFIFATTEAERIPATILSRCQRFDFRNIPTRLIAEHLASICEAEGVTVEPDALLRIARAAEGSMRDGLSLLDQLLSAGGEAVTDADVVRVLGTPPDERTTAILTAVADCDAAAALGELDAVLAAGVNLPAAAAGLADAYRHLMLAKTCGPDSELIELTDAARKEIAALAERFSLPAVVQGVAVLQAASRNLRGSSVAQALLEAAIVRLADAEKFVDAADLLRRLEALESGSPAPRAAGGASRKSVPPPPGGQKKKPAAVGEYAPAAPQPRSPSPAQPQPRASHPGSPPGQSPPTPAAAGNAPGGQEPAGQSAESALPRRDAPPAATLSTAEKEQVNADPAVRGTLDLFGGKVVDYRHHAPAPAEPAPLDDEADAQDPEADEGT